MEYIEIGGILFPWQFFFFQAEDGIRDGRVTGVQTCALPIYCCWFFFGKTNERNITDKIEPNNWQHETSSPCWGISPQQRLFNVAFLTEDHMVTASLSP